MNENAKHLASNHIFLNLTDCGVQVLMNSKLHIRIFDRSRERTFPIIIYMTGVSRMVYPTTQVL